MTTKAKLIPLGFIQSTHGLKGEVLVVLDSGEPLEPFPTTLYVGQKSSVESDLQILEIENIRWAHKGPIVQFQGYHQRSQADSLKGLTLYFNSEAFQSEQFHLFEILGFLVQIQKGKELKNLGYVSHFISHSHQDLLAVKCTEDTKKKKKTSIIKKHEKQVEIPFVASYIQNIDFKAKKMILKLPEGFPGIDDHEV